LCTPKNRHAARPQTAQNSGRRKIRKPWAPAGCLSAGKERNRQNEINRIICFREKAGRVFFHNKPVKEISVVGKGFAQVLGRGPVKEKDMQVKFALSEKELRKLRFLPGQDHAQTPPKPDLGQDHFPGFFVGWKRKRE